MTRRALAKGSLPVRLLERTVVLLGLSSALACAPYYLVESRLVESSRRDLAADVTVAAAYQSALPLRPRVALQAPDSCANISAAEAEGHSEAGNQILRTACGVEMAGLERALSRAGYPVSSWKAVSQIVEKEKLTPLAAAARLDADVLFQVNSLERSRTNPGRELRWERRFYQSNERAEKGELAGVVEERAQALELLASLREQELMPGSRMSATVNASAVLIETGETIWFYEHTQVEPFDRDQVAVTLAVCTGSKCEPRIPVTKKVKSAKTTRYGSIEAVSMGSRDAAAEDVIYHDLVADLIDDLVKRFAGRSK